MIREVAVKLLAPVKDASDGQIQELIAATTLKHPHLVDSYDVGSCTLNGAEFLYLVMELASESLEAHFKNGPLAAEEMSEIMRSISSALMYLHSQNKTHCDLKPDNILKVGNVWKLSDFGLLRSLEQEKAIKTMGAFGTAAYVPPEAYDGIISPAWDVWSLGVILVEGLTGQLPFLAETPHHLQKAVLTETPGLSGLVAPLQEIAKGCLIKDQEKRWTALQVIQRFVSFNVSQPEMASGTSIKKEEEHKSSTLRKNGKIVRVSMLGDADFTKRLSL